MSLTSDSETLHYLPQNYRFTMQLAIIYLNPNNFSSIARIAIIDTGRILMQYIISTIAKAYISYRYCNTIHHCKYCNPKQYCNNRVYCNNIAIMACNCKLYCKGSPMQYNAWKILEISNLLQ